MNRLLRVGPRESRAKAFSPSRDATFVGVRPLIVPIAIVVVALIAVATSVTVHFDFAHRASPEMIDNSHFSQLNDVLNVYDGTPDAMGWLSLAALDQPRFPVNRMSGRLARFFGLRQSVILLVPLFGGILAALFGCLLAAELGGRRAGILAASTLMTTPLVFGNARSLGSWTLIFALYLCLIWLLARYHRRLTAIDAALVGIPLAGCFLFGVDHTSHLIFLCSAGLVVICHVATVVFTKRLTMRRMAWHAAAFLAPIVAVEALAGVHRRLIPIFGSFGYDYYVEELYQFGQRYGIWRGLPYFAVDIWTNTLRPGGTILCVSGLAAFALRMPKWRRQPMLWALGLGFAALSLLTKKNTWYSYELTVLAVALACVGVSDLLARAHPRVVVSGWIVWHAVLILQMVFATYGPQPAMPAIAYHQWAGGYPAKSVAVTLDESGPSMYRGLPGLEVRLGAEFASRPKALIALALEEDSAMNLVPFAIRKKLPDARLRSACEPDLPPLGQGLDAVVVISKPAFAGPFATIAKAVAHPSEVDRFCTHPFRGRGFGQNFSTDRFEANRIEWQSHRTAEMTDGIRLYLPNS